MKIVGPFRSRAPRRSSFLAVVLACGLLPGAAQAAPVGPGQANLSPRLQELASPEVRSAPADEQAAQLGLPVSGPGSLLRTGSRVLVEVRFDHGAAAGVDDLEAAGGEIVDLSRRYQTVTVAAKPGRLTALGRVAGVGGVTEVLAPVFRGPDCGGSVRSEGDVQLRAAGARANWGVDGSGVTVGILSDSFDRKVAAATHAPGDVASGDLPGPGSPCGSTQPVGVFGDSDFGGGDEGRAMAQVVHDLAPGAAIDFATAFAGEQVFADNIRALAAGGAGVIADDVVYPQEPFFQDGPVAQAVGEVTAGGVSYFSAAGNDNLIDGEGNDIASWEAPAFRDSGSCPAAIVSLSEALEKEEEEAELPVEGLNPSHCLDFDPGAGEDQTFGITVEEGETLRLDLQWAEPWFGVGTDLDAFLLNEEGKLLEPEVEGEPAPLASTEDNIGGSQQPFEFLSWENVGPGPEHAPEPEQEVQLVVNRFSGTEPRLKFALMENGPVGVSGTEYPKSAAGDIVGPTIFGHTGSVGAISVGAVPFSESAEPESFSSRGPVTHYFGPVSGVTPAPLLGSPQTIAKPDLAATDCGVTTFFSIFVGVWRFCGTSAAAPHAAGVAALVRQGNPGASAAQVRSDLAATARPVGAFGPEAVGAGLIDADAAVNSLALPPRIAIAKPPPALGRERRPTIEFGANRPVAFSCAIDGGAAQPCASPFTFPAELADGEHGIAVTGTDLAGRVGGDSARFRVDTTAPKTFIVVHPPKVLRTHRRRVRAIFRFRSNEAGVRFVCKVDRDLLRFCGSRFARRYVIGGHVLKVRAQDAAGNLDRSAAVFRFRVKRVG